MASVPASLKKPSVPIPAAAVGLYVFSRWFGRDPNAAIRLTQPSGDPILVRESSIFAVFTAPTRQGATPLTRLYVEGIEHLDVREPVHVVLSQIRGHWIGLHLPERNGTLEEIQVFIDASKLSTVRAGDFRQVDQASSMAELVFFNGRRLRVTEDVPSIQHLIG